MTRRLAKSAKRKSALQAEMASKRIVSGLISSGNFKACLANPSQSFRDLGLCASALLYLKRIHFGGKVRILGLFLGQVGVEGPGLGVIREF